MADVAAEARNYVKADSGAGDKTALVALMFRLGVRRTEPGILTKLCNQVQYGEPA